MDALTLAAKQSQTIAAQQQATQTEQIDPRIVKALGAPPANKIPITEVQRQMLEKIRDTDKSLSTLPAGPGNSHAIQPSSGPGLNEAVSPIEPEVVGLPSVLNVNGALSAALITTVGGANTQTSEVDLLADWDGREDITADRAARIAAFAPNVLPPPIGTATPLPPNYTLTRAAISEHTLANGHAFNSYYYGDSVGNLYFGFDVAGDSVIDTAFTANLPAIVNAGAGGSGGFTLTSPTAGDCMDGQAIVTGIAVNPVADLGDFDPALCGTVGEVIYISTLETSGCAANAANQPIRSRIFAFAIYETGATEIVSGKVLQILRTPLSDIAGVAVDDDGSLYFQLTDLAQLDPVTGLGGQGTIFKATERARNVCATPGRVNRVITLMPTPPTVNSAQGTTANPIINNTGVRLTNFSLPSPNFGNITSITSGPHNVLYAAVAASNTGVGDPTQGFFKASLAFPNGLPAMIITFADVSGNTADTCTSPGAGQPGSIPSGDGFADPTGAGAPPFTWRAFVLGNGPDIRGGSASAPVAATGTTADTLKLDMLIDPTIYSGIAVNEEGSVFVISGGTPSGIGNNPSPGRTEILGFEDLRTYDRRADFVDFRGDILPNPPASGGNVGDGDSDRFDHVFYIAPKDVQTLQPLGLAGLARGFLRYTNRLAPTAISPGLTLGNTVGVQTDNSTDGAIPFEGFDPGHQVAGGDDQNVPFRGDDDDGAGTPASPGALNGGFEFSFGGPNPAGCTWNGFFLNSNGSISFGSGDTDNTPTAAEFRSGAPRIAPAWADLNPNTRATNVGTFPVQAMGFANVNAFKLRWINVPQVGSEACSAGNTINPGISNTFGLVLYDDGVGLDENANQPLNPANPIGNNAVPFDLQEGPDDLRFIREPNTGVLTGSNPRRDGSGNFIDSYSHMDLIGTAAAPVITGYSIGGLAGTNPPGTCEIDLSSGSRSAETALGVIQGQTANLSLGFIGEGTEGTLFEVFNSGTVSTPDFDLRFEGNDPASASAASQALDLSKGAVGFFGIGCAPPAASQGFTVIPDPFLTTPTTTGLINAIGPVTLNLFGAGFFQNEATTVCAAGGESGPRLGKTVTTAATLGYDTNADNIPDQTLALTNVTPISASVIKATLPPAPGLPGSPFPLDANGGTATVTVTTTVTAGDNNAFGAFTRTTAIALSLGVRAPVVTSVTPASGGCGGAQSLALGGSVFQFTQFGGSPNVVTDVIATEIGNAANVVHASSVTVVDNTHVNATIDFGGAGNKSFLIQAVGTSGGRSRNMITLPGGAPPPLGNEAGNLINFSCGGGEQLQFSAAQASVVEDVIVAPLTITRASPGAGTITVDFNTVAGTANQIADYTTMFGTVTFAPGETSKVINIPITQDAYVEPNEYLQVTLSNPTGGAAVGVQPTELLIINNDDLAPSAVNPIDTASIFVNQHYHDFLSRQGDAAGVNFWTNGITSCVPAPLCTEVLRINTSAAFFLSTEFQETGFNVIRSQRVAFGKKSADAATRYPYLSFLKDAQKVGAGVIIGQPGDLALLETNKQAYATSIVTSAPFIAAYPLVQTSNQYVDALFNSAAVLPTSAERTAAITAFGAGGTAGRVAAFRSVVDSNSVRLVETNPAFVLMEYYGYLRRNPTDSPDIDDSGYQFWLNKLNAFDGNFVAAEMVKAFLSSSEYRQRFNTP